MALDPVTDWEVLAEELNEAIDEPEEHDNEVHPFHLFTKWHLMSEEERVQRRQDLKPAETDVEKEVEKLAISLFTSLYAFFDNDEYNQ